MIFYTNSYCLVFQLELDDMITLAKAALGETTTYSGEALVMEYILNEVDIPFVSFFCFVDFLKIQYVTFF